MAGRAADLVTQVLGMDRLVELLFDNPCFLVVAVGTGAGRLFGIGGMRVIVVAFVMALGARQSLVVGAFEGFGIFEQTAQFLEVQAFFGRVRDTGFAVAGQARVVGFGDLFDLLGRQRGGGLVLGMGRTGCPGNELQARDDNKNFI
jgi:hypothetical protein